MSTEDLSSVDTLRMLRLHSTLTHRYREHAFDLLGQRLMSFEAFREDTGLPFIVAAAERLFEIAHPEPGMMGYFPFSLVPDETQDTASGCKVVLKPAPASLTTGLQFLDTAVEMAVNGSPDPKFVNLDHYVDAFYARQAQAELEPETEAHITPASERA